MWYIIIGLIILGLITSFFEWLSDLVGGALPLIIIIAVLVTSYLAFSWEGVFTVIAIAVVGAIVIGLLKKAGIYVNDKVEAHDKRAKETAQIKQQTQAEQITHNNDAALMQELAKNCTWLGYMDAQMWAAKLSNFVGRSYSTSFEEVTSNFAKQIEQQYILQNDDWFEPYKLYVLNHPGGSTVTKMIAEVDCPQLKMTHCTPDGDLINTWLMRGTKAISRDVPALFNVTFIKDINENLFTPTLYLKKLYSVAETAEDNHVEEISFDDL